MADMNAPHPEPQPAPVVSPEAAGSSTAATAAVHGPYEDLAMKVLDVIEKVLDGQPADVRKQLWQWYIEDMKGWREFWK